MNSEDASARVERLLTELRGAVSPMAWTRVDELMTTLVEVYGRALGQLLDAADPARRAQLAEDPLLGSLLALHGLHPLPVEARVRTALEELSPRLGRLELIGLDGGTVRLRALDAPIVRGLEIEQALQEIAPELVRVEVEGLREAQGPLVQIDLQRSRGRRA